MSPITRQLRWGSIPEVLSAIHALLASPAGRREEEILAWLDFVYGAALRIGRGHRPGMIRGLRLRVGALEADIFFRAERLNFVCELRGYSESVHRC